MKTCFLLAVVLFFVVCTSSQPAFSTGDLAHINSTSPLRKNLEGYWRLGEATGTTRYDDSKNGVHLTSNNGVSQQVGMVNNCSGFVSASTQYLSAANTNQLQFLLSTPFTLAAWVKLTNNATTQTLVSKFTASPFRGYMTYVQAGKFKVVLYSTSTASKILAANAVITNAVWHFLVGTHDGTGTTNGLKVWVDGTNDTTAVPTTAGTLTDINNTAEFNVGVYGSSISPANGLIDEVGVWSRVLTTNEIGKLYRSGLGTHFPWAHP